MNPTQTNYKLVKGPDSITWCSLEPLMNDIKNSIIHLMDLELPQDEEMGRDQKLMGLKAVYEILGALVQEANLVEYKNATIN